MRRIVTHPAAAFLGFLMGLLAHGLWPPPPPKVNEPEALTISFCELARNSEKYNGKLVRVRATLHAYLGPFIYDWSCAERETQAPPLIAIHETDYSTLPGWAQAALCCGGSDPLNNCKGPPSGEVFVVGTFRVDDFALGAQPAKRQLSIAPRSFFTLPPGDDRR